MGDGLQSFSDDSRRDRRDNNHQEARNGRTTRNKIAQIAMTRG